MKGPCVALSPTHWGRGLVKWGRGTTDGGTKPVANRFIGS